MKIHIGSKNEVKVSALRETVSGYGFLKDAIVAGIETGSGVSDQPKNLEETIRGAKNRARAAFAGCDLGAGIEDGLMEVPGSRTGFMNITVCAFYDGKQYFLGTSAAFEYPPRAVELVEGGLDINQAFHEMKLTDDPRVGSSRGAIGILTKGRWQRKDTVKQAIVAALIQLDNKNLY